MIQAYCLKCHTEREMLSARSVTMKNGRRATRGVCPVCRTEMYRIGKSGDAVLGTMTKATNESWLADVAADKVFWCYDGRVMKNPEQLGAALQEMSEETFQYHVTADRNDFSKWVEDVVGDHELSAGLRTSSTRSQAGKVVADRIVWLKGQGGTTSR